MKIFLISGKAGSGKTEVANILKQELGNTVITNFSKYLKLYALEFTDWDGKDITKPRIFLQEMGDTVRKIDQNFLINRMLDDFKVYETRASYVVVSDVRTKYEIEKIEEEVKFSVVTIRVNASSSKRILTEKEKQHKTELDLDNYQNFDYIIENQFDDTLKEKVKEIIAKEK